MRTCLIFHLGHFSYTSEFLLVLKFFLWDVSCDTFSSLDYESIMICVVCRDMFLSTVEVLLLFVYLLDTTVLEISSVFWLRSQSIVFFCQSIFCVVCRDMFLSTAIVLLLLVDFFDTIVFETPPVKWLRNQSIVFVYIFDYVEDIWIHVLNRMNQKWVGFFQSRV